MDAAARAVSPATATPRIPRGRPAPAPSRRGAAAAAPAGGPFRRPPRWWGPPAPGGWWRGAPPRARSPPTRARACPPRRRRPHRRRRRPRRIGGEPDPQQLQLRRALRLLLLQDAVDHLGGNTGPRRRRLALGTGRAGVPEGQKRRVGLRRLEGAVRQAPDDVDLVECRIGEAGSRQEEDMPARRRIVRRPAQDGERYAQGVLDALGELVVGQAGSLRSYPSDLAPAGRH